MGHLPTVLLFDALLIAHFIAAAPAAQAAHLREQGPGQPASPPKRLVLFDHDGGVDDFITLLLVLSCDPADVTVLGITILDGDCHVDVAANTTLKLLHLLGHDDIPVGVSTLQAANPFPAAYRSQGLILDVLPVLNQHKSSELATITNRQPSKEPGQELFAQLLLKASLKVTVIATGPLSNLAYALEKYPTQIADKIERVWWMGGALRVKGNVYEPRTDGSAEWNSYWDPAAAGVVWRSNVPLTLVPLDGTNKVPITPDLVYSFGPQSHHLYSLLAGTFYAPVVSWVYTTPGDPYYAWDALTAVCWMEPSLCKVQTDLQVAVVLSGPAQGATVLAAPQHAGAGSATPTPPQPAAAGTPAAALHLPEAGDQAQQQQWQRRHQQASEAASVQQSHGVERLLLASSAGGAAALLQASADAGAAAAAAVGSGGGSSSQHRQAVLSVQGTDVTRQLSAVKSVSAVMDVDAREFHSYILERLRM